MKKILLAAIIAAHSTVSTAGGLAPAAVEEMPIIETKPASSISPFLILGLIVLIGVVVGSNNEGGKIPCVKIAVAC